MEGETNDKGRNERWREKLMMEGEKNHGGRMNDLGETNDGE
jgi:hypothetical protein